jgi:predicted  nucleic acid-binding Zn-ribbon protein
LQLKQEKEQDKLTALQDKVVAAKQELEAVKASIQERKDYQKQQEELIAKQSEDGNLQLRSLEYEIIESKQVIKDLEQKRRNLYEEGQTLESDLEAARNSFTPELEKHEAAVVVIVQRKEVLETDLQIAQKKIYDTNIELNKLLLRRKQIHADVDAKLQLLDSKEREIMAKREALRQEREEMEETKHYYQSPKSLYDTI